MDGFSIYFLRSTSLAELASIGDLLGALVANQAPDKVAMMRGDGKIWLYLWNAEELADSRAVNDGGLRKPGIIDPTSAVEVIVGRSDASVPLALELAWRVSTMLGGEISWDGMSEWEAQYLALLAFR